MFANIFMVNILPVLIIYAIILILAIVVISLVFRLLVNAIVFSRITFSLFVAYLIARDKTILAGHSFLNFGIWAIIILGIVFLLTMLPRIDTATNCFCTVFVSNFIIALVAVMGCSIISDITGKQFDVTMTMEIVIKIIIALFTGIQLVDQIKYTISDSSNNAIINFCDRLISSCVYGLAAVILFGPFNGTWEFSLTAQYVVLFVATVVAFIADIIFSRYSS